MHDPSAQGNDFFKCDFCRQPWSDDRPMVEGHKGSLICGRCLAVAFDELWNRGAGVRPAGVGPDSSAHDRALATCTLCLELRDEPYWYSPLHPEVGICRRCTKQSAVMLERDPDSGWKRPGKAG